MRTPGRLKTLALVGVVAIMVAGCSGGAGGGDKAGGGGEPVVLRMANTASGLGFSPPLDYFLERVKELSRGDLRIDVVFQWGNFSSDAEQQAVRDVAAGKADLTSVGPRVFDTLGVKNFRALTAPMLIDGYPLEDAVIKSGIPGEMLTRLGKLEVTGLGVLGGSLNKPIAVEKPLLGPSDWQGITFETYRSQTQAQAIRALGAQSTDVLGPALDAGLKNGQIQGFSKGLLVYKINATALIAPYVTANVNLWPGMQVLLANPGRLSRLSQEHRGWLRQAAADAAARSTSLVEKEDQIVTDLCQAGARFANASEANLTALRQAFVPVYSSLEQDPQTKAFIAGVEALKQSTPAGAPLAIPAGCTGSASGSPATNDPIAGSWTTAKLTESQMVRAFVAAGGSEKDGHALFSTFDDHETKHYALITLTFQDGSWGEYQGGDGRPAVKGAGGPYELGDEGIVTLDEACCTTTYRYDLSGDTLRFHGVKKLDPYDATLFATFPFTRSG